MEKNLTSSPAADQKTSPGPEQPPHNSAETAENAVFRAAERDEAPTPENERNALKGRKTRKTETPDKDLMPDSLTTKPVSEWTTEDGAQAIRDFMGILPERFVKAYLKAETGAANGTRPDTAVSSKSVYLAIVRAYIKDAVNNLRSADEDHNPQAARDIYRTEMAIGDLLQRHLDLPPAEMTDFLPDQSKISWGERIPEIQASRTLFFMDHLHRILFRPEEPDPQDTAE